MSIERLSAILGTGAFAGLVFMFGSVALGFTPTEPNDIVIWSEVIGATGGLIVCIYGVFARQARNGE